MAPGDDTDSGMESQESQGEVSFSAIESGTSGVSGKGGDLGDEPDETLAERLWGLTEMFPEPVRNATHTLVTTTTYSVKTFYAFSRSAFWILFSSSIILFAPVIFEVERIQMEEAQRTQQKQMLLGPNTAVSGSGGPPLLPQMHR